MYASNSDRREASFATELFQVPSHRVVVWARLVLAALGVLVVLVDPPPPVEARTLVSILLTGYLIASAILVFSPLRPTRTVRFGLHAFDTAMSAALMWLTEGAASPFFAYFVFVLVSAALNWEWKGVIATSVVLATALLVMFISGALQFGFGLNQSQLEIDRAAMRGGFIIVGGILLAYLAAHREFSRNRFAALAAWASIRADGSSSQAISAALARATALMNVSSAFLVWQEEGETQRLISHWPEDVRDSSLEGWDVEIASVRKSHEQEAFWYDGRYLCGQEGPMKATEYSLEEYIDPNLLNIVGASTFITAPFEFSRCKGRLFLFNKPHWSRDDLLIAQIVASRIGIDIEQNILRHQVESDAVTRERMRVANDLHDGILQNLAAASLHLKASGTGDAAIDGKRLKTVEMLLTSEAKRIRSFVQRNRTPSRPGGVVPVQPKIRRHMDRLQQQWNCRISLNVSPPNLAVSLINALHLRLAISESVSNAVRHGRASTVEIIVELLDGKLVLCVKDDGQGFDLSRGNLTPDNTTCSVTVPASLETRMNEIGGAISLTSCSSGANIRMEFPA